MNSTNVSGDIFDTYVKQFINVAKPLDRVTDNEDEHDPKAHLAKEELF